MNELALNSRTWVGTMNKMREGESMIGTIAFRLDLVLATLKSMRIGNQNTTRNFPGIPMQISAPEIGTGVRRIFRRKSKHSNCASLARGRSLRHSPTLLSFALCEIVPSATLDVEFGTEAHSGASNWLEGMKSVVMWWYQPAILHISSNPGAPRVRFVGCHIVLDVLHAVYADKVISYDISAASLELLQSSYERSSLVQSMSDFFLCNCTCYLPIMTLIWWQGNTAQLQERL
ncbi:hypothetical protein EDD85DRAFT_786444 [Armillaria nabsnona]|nr:hypothetical protein EDD85DRAFT_786444 [Armillaria nabsnona]